MTRQTKTAFSLMLASILVLILGCSVVPQGIKQIFATETPTSTATLTATATPTATATATATPLPPVSLSICAEQDDCPEAVSFYGILLDSLEFDSVNDVTIPYNTPLLINQYWQSMDEELLQENIEYIDWYFKIDGQEYFQDAWLEHGFFEDYFDPTQLYPGYQWGVVLDDWKIGESHLIEVGYIITEPFYDGWNNYESGFESNIILRIIPTELPTATPTPTKTLTPKPTSIPYTSTPKPTAGPACEVNSTIEIDNTTGAWMTLKLKGPGTFKFDLATGITTLDVCSGNYSYEAWGCGGAYDSGNINSSEAHEFYCY